MSLYNYVVFGHEIEAYLTWLERLRQYYFSMAYNATTPFICGVNLFMFNRKWNREFFCKVLVKYGWN